MWGRPRVGNGQEHAVLRVQDSLLVRDFLWAWTWDGVGRLGRRVGVAGLTPGVRCLETQASQRGERPFSSPPNELAIASYQGLGGDLHQVRG